MDHAREQDRMQSLKHRNVRARRWKDWSSANKEQLRVKRRADGLQRNFGLSVGDYDEMLARQGGACAICKNPESVTRDGKVKRLAVDHCHETDRVRGLLCQRCNLLIGLADDDGTRLASAVAYLNQVPPADEKADAY